MSEMKYIRPGESDSPADLALQRALDTFLSALAADGRPVAASRVRDGDSMYVVTRCMVLRRPVREDERNFGPGLVHPATDSKEVGLLNVPGFTMSRLIGPDLVELPGVPREHDALLPVTSTPLGEPGIWLLEYGHGNCAKFMTSIPSDGLSGLRSGLYTAPSWLLEGLGDNLSGIGAWAGVAAGGGDLMLMLSGDTMSAVVAPSKLHLDSGIDSVRMPDESVLMLDGWSEEHKAWSGLVRSGLDEMKSRGNPLRKVSRRKLQGLETAKAEDSHESKESKEKETESMTYELNSDDKSIHDAAVEAVGVSLADLAAARKQDTDTKAETPAPEPPPPVPESAPEPATEPAPEPEPEAVTPSEPETTAEPAAAPVAQPRQKRQSAPQAGVQLAKVTEWLARPVPAFSPADLQAGVDEMRQLRDLIIVASRRMTNLSVEAFKVSKSSVDKVAAIQAVMGDK